MKEFHREILKVKDKEGRCFGLIETKNQYIVACYYQPSRRWGHGIYYSFLNEREKIFALEKASHILRRKADIYTEDEREEALHNAKCGGVPVESLSKEQIMYYVHDYWNE
ncbi:hypothetical protein [Butyribacter intestini]|uniref:hypothetical protein n=1 Tax=Butyribacter intestini TaxID=1703332 RepID=UPI0022E67587|nr:hypothetical protein [Butyribacter intestini]